MTGTGVAYARKRAKERQAQFSSPFLFIRENGERARIRFLTDTEQFFQGMFHRPYDGKKVDDPVVCVETDDKPPVIEGMGEVCSFCEMERKTDKKQSPGYKYFAWVYVYHILHTSQNPRLEKDATAPVWKSVKLGRGDAAAVFYKQEVNKVKMMLFGQPLFDDLMALIAEADEDADEDADASGLLRRDFSFVRNGARKDPKTTYTFVPANKESDLSEAVSKAIDGLGSLTEAALAGTVAHYSRSTGVSDEDEEAEDIESGATEEAEESEGEAESEEEETEVADNEDFDEV